MDPLTAHDFEPHLGTQFIVSGQDDPITATLVDLRELNDPGEASRSPFTLSFRGPSDPILSQATYEFTHPELGLLEIFVVPVASDDEGTTYQAIFN